MRTAAVLAVVSLCLWACSPAPPETTATVASTPTLASSATPATPRATASPTEIALADLVDGSAMLAHLEELQRIADESGGNRATSSVGHQTSVSYLHRVLLSAHYFVDHQEFSLDGRAGVNLVVERGGASENVIMLGAHLDSVADGPGINDNGSGVAALLVIAERLRQLPPMDLTVRFAFWDAEEGGTIGSLAYLDALTPEERSRITTYLNFDMIGSPNAIRFVYDERGATPGSEVLTDLFATYFDDAGLAWQPIDLEGDSDHGPFSDAGIPTGGLFSGGIEPVTDAQAATFGAIADQPADPCSHRACDTIDNVDLATLAEMADAIAHVLTALAAE